MARLLGDAGEECALLLRFDHARGFAIDQEEVVTRAGLEGSFTNRDAPTRERVELPVVLNQPSGRDELLVDLLASLLLRIDVGNGPALRVGGP